jgi:hypothetical protein
MAEMIVPSLIYLISVVVYPFIHHRELRECLISDLDKKEAHRLL